ncbi:MAG: RES family NAD+ phosphorylase [Burkholderiaceae bacterium]|nr:RES family NAD+ phosphorylase [Burkholderiaceae bacterium]
MPGVVVSELALPPIAAIRQFDTVRLIPSRFAETTDSVLQPIANDVQHLNDLFDLDNATNQRLLGEFGGLPGIGVDELVFGIPNFRIINAAFTYPRPEGSRFNNGERGAWYCAFDAQTALAEVIFHKSVEYAEIDRFEDTVSYQAYFSDFNAEFHDLRGGRRFKDCLNPESYILPQSLAAQLLANGSLGVVYPSVRHATGTNLVCFRPALVGNVRKAEAYRMSWSGTPEPSIEIMKTPHVQKKKKKS